MKFTILVPCYHSNKQYFLECIESIVKQTYTDFECIVISSDDEITKKDLPINDNRFVYVRCEKKSSGYKRNYGIKNGTGDYIVFIDSDDIIANTYLETIAKASKNEDIVLFPITTMIENLSKKPSLNFHCEKNFFFLNKYIIKFTKVNEIECPSWAFSGNPCKAYRINWLKENSLLIDEEFGLIGEDKIFNLRCALKNPSIIFFENYYPYWWRPNELSFYHKNNSTKELNWLPTYISKIDSILCKTNYYNNFKNNIKKKICLYWLPNAIRKNHLKLSDTKLLIISLFDSELPKLYFKTDIYLDGDKNPFHKIIYKKTTKYVCNCCWAKMGILYKFYERVTRYKGKFKSTLPK